MSARTNDSRALRTAQTDEEVVDLKRMRAKVIARHLMSRGDDSRTDQRPTPAKPSELRSGVTVFEVVMFFLAAALTIAALDGAPSFFHWAFK